MSVFDCILLDIPRSPEWPCHRTNEKLNNDAVYKIMCKHGINTLNNYATHFISNEYCSLHKAYLSAIY